MGPLEAIERPEPPGGGTDAVPPGRGRASVLRTVASVGLGVLLIVLLLYHAGVDDIHERMGELGWVSPLVLAPLMIIAWFDAMGWRCTLPAAAATRIPLRSLVLVRMAGEAVNSVTPTAAVGGEPVKAHLLRAWGVSGS